MFIDFPIKKSTGQDMEDIFSTGCRRSAPDGYDAIASIDHKLIERIDDWSSEDNGIIDGSVLYLKGGDVVHVFMDRTDVKREKRLCERKEAHEILNRLLTVNN